MWRFASDFIGKGDVGEWVALALKVLTYAIGLVVMLAGKGCGPI